jgi:hypothetical protein
MYNIIHYLLSVIEEVIIQRLAFHNRFPLFYLCTQYCEHATTVCPVGYLAVLVSLFVCTPVSKFSTRIHTPVNYST